jgi:hypothetical protein
MQLTDNPLQPHDGHKRSLSDRVSERRGNAYLAVRVLYQPGWYLCIRTILTE